MKRNYLLALILVMLVNIGYSQTEKRVFKVIRTNQCSDLNDALGTEVWKSVPVASYIVQYMNVHDINYAKRTKLKIKYEDNSIYFYAALFNVEFSVNKTFVKRSSNSDSRKIFDLIISNQGVEMLIGMVPSQPLCKEA